LLGAAKFDLLLVQLNNPVLMISIVICSINENLFKEVSVNIKKTIGTALFEIIRVDNNVEKLSIFEAYNKGGSLAKFPIILFLHEDILFKSKKWGEILIKEFEQKELGLIGLIGAKYKSKVPSGWYADMSTHFGHIFYNIGESEQRLQYNYVQGIEEVVLVDGLFMATTKKVFDQCRFDTKTYKGFHFYDTDYSTTVASKKYKVVVTNKIDVFHKSQGNVDGCFYESMMQYDKKWNMSLPLSVLAKNEGQINLKLEWYAFIRFTRLVIKFEEKLSDIIKVVFSQKPKEVSLLLFKFWIVLIVEIIKNRYGRIFSK